MEENNILSGDLNTLVEIKNMVELHNSNVSENNQAEADMKKLQKEINSNKKNLKDMIESTIKKRREEIASKYDSEINKCQDKIKKIKNSREKAKEQGVKGRIDNETADLCDQNIELRNNIKTALKGERLPGFCGGGLYQALYFTKGAGEVFTCILSIFIMCLALPAAIYIILMRFIPEKFKTLTLALVFFVVIVIVFLLYKLIGDKTKQKHRDTLDNVSVLYDQITSNKKKIRQIAAAIKKDKNEDMYQLGDFDSKIKMIEMEIDDISQQKAEAIDNFNRNVATNITDEINNRELPRIQDLEERYDAAIKVHENCESNISQLSLKLSNCEAYLGKEYLTVDKLNELVKIMETGSAMTISDAINQYKTSAM